jgi:bifunctional non-homologous end joining protein LigD
MSMILPAPMLLDEGRVGTPLGKPGWIYEIKYDGWRVLAGIVDGKVHLATRNGADYTKAFPEVAKDLSTLDGGPHILDGEVCVLDDAGRSDFMRLQERARRKRWYEGCDPVVYCVFDLLAKDGRSLIDQPVEKRKQQLRDMLSPDLPAVLYVDHFPAEHGRALFEQAKALGIEGLVAKRLGSTYHPGERSLDWVKVKRKGAIPPERFKR